MRIDPELPSVQIIEGQGSRILTLEHALDQALLVIADLREQLKDQQILEEQLSETELFSHIQQKAIVSLQKQLQQKSDQLSEYTTLNERQTKTIDRVQDDLALTSLKKEELEVQIAHLVRREAHLQQQCQEFSELHDRQQERTQILEQQMTDLQEQVLYQVQQIREQETAVQHWKARCEAIYQQLQAVVNRHESDRHIPLPELKEAIGYLGWLTSDPRSSEVASSPSAKIELPRFLEV